MKDQFLDAMSRVANSVCVVTTDGAHGRAGMTVSALTSVSVDAPKPLLLVCLHSDASACATIRSNGCFCVNYLQASHSHIADRFAGRTGLTGAARFDGLEWSTSQTQAPRLATALSSFDCKIIQENIAGSHHILLGAVQSVASLSSGHPLIYADRTYKTLCD